MICRTFGTLFWALLLAALLASRGMAATAPYRPLFIVSLDGFRWDYCDRYPEHSPTLRRLRAEGAGARALVPVFPSNTFPNHYSIVTGLRPSRHGVINNNMFDPTTEKFFRINMPGAARDPQWWGGEPIWVSAEMQGKVSACSFWVGSEARIKGIQPTFWKPFDYSIPFEKRLDELVSWLSLPAGRRPELVTFYLEETNDVGHRHGPDSNEIAPTIQLMDTRVRRIIDACAKLGVEPDLVLVSDHGMTELKAERCVFLDDFLHREEVQVDFAGPVAGLRPLDGDVAALLEQLAALPAGAKAWSAEKLPSSFALGGHPRVPPVWVLAQPGGWVDWRANIEKNLPTTRGEHGYDPEIPEMHGILIVHGPSFRSDGYQVEKVENIHLYNLFCRVLGIQAAPNDGDQRLTELLRRD